MEEGLNVEHSFSFSEGDERFDIKNFSGRVELVGDAYILDGNMAFSFSCPCDRCLGDIVLDYNERVFLTLSPVGQYAEAGTDEEVGLSDEEAGIYVTEHDHFNLEEFLRDEVLLHIPVKRLCDDSCKGICADCGSNLNVDKCVCTVKADSPFAVLSQLKKDNK